MHEVTIREPFTYNYLEYMLGTAAQAGYVISSFENYSQKHPKTVILRHDVDLRTG